MKIKPNPLPLQGNKALPQDPAAWIIKKNEKPKGKGADPGVPHPVHIGPGSNSDHPQERSKIEEVVKDILNTAESPVSAYESLIGRVTLLTQWVSPYFVSLRTVLIANPYFFIALGAAAVCAGLGIYYWVNQKAANLTNSQSRQNLSPPIASVSEKLQPVTILIPQKFSVNNDLSFSIDGDIGRLQYTPLEVPANEEFDKQPVMVVFSIVDKEKTSLQTFGAYGKVGTRGDVSFTIRREHLPKIESIVIESVALSEQEGVQVALRKQREAFSVQTIRA